MAKINYHHLYYFWRVALSGSITKTADECHVSQSALSQQIKQLETSMDVRLFERAGRQLLLTDVGRKVLSYADEIFTTGEELQSFINKGGTATHQYWCVDHLIAKLYRKLYQPAAQTAQCQLHTHHSGYD